MASCNVALPEPGVPPGGDDVLITNLTRASQALLERIQREREHVQSLQVQLLELRGQEEILHGEYLQAEKDYQFLLADLEEVRAEKKAVEEQLVAAVAPPAEESGGVDLAETLNYPLQLETAQAEIETTREDLALSEEYVAVLLAQIEEQKSQLDAFLKYVDAPPSELAVERLPGNEVESQSEISEPSPADGPSSTVLVLLGMVGLSVLMMYHNA